MMMPQSDKRVIHEVASVVLSRCDPTSLARIHASSKQTAALCALYIQQNHQQVLLQAVRLAAVHSSSCKHAHAVEWVLKVGKIDPLLLLRMAGQFLHIPNVPEAVARSLLCAGLRFTWQEIAAAANEQLAGLEVWVAVRAISGLPVMVKEICNRHPKPGEQYLSQSFVQLQPQQLPGILHFAALLRDTDAAASYILQALFDPYHDWDIEPPCLQQLQRQVTPALLQQLIDIAAHKDLYPCLIQTISSYIPAAAEVPQDHVIHLLHEAVQYGRSCTVRALLTLPQCQQLHSNLLADLLQEALQQGQEKICRFLLRAPKGRMEAGEFWIDESISLPLPRLQQLLQLAFQRLQDGSEVTQFLMKLYVKQQPTAEALMPILHLALPHCSPNKPSHGELPLTDILLSPGAYHLPASTIQDLVRVCLRLSDWAHGPLILGLPAAHLMSPYAVACLLDFAISMSVSTNHNRPYHYPSQHGLIFKALCKLPGAANMSAVQLTKFLMRAPLPQSTYSLLELPAADDLEAHTLEFLMQRAISTADRELLERLWTLSGAAKLSCNMLLNLCRTAVADLNSASHYTVHMRWLVAVKLFKRALTSATQDGADSQQVLDILRTAMLRCTSKHCANLACFGEMLSIAHAAGLVGCNDVAQLLFEALAFERQDCPRDSVSQLVKALLQAPSVAAFEADQIRQLLQFELSTQFKPDGYLVSKLCDLPEADGITGSGLANLLQTAIQQASSYEDFFKTYDGSLRRTDVWDAVVTRLFELPAARTGELSTESVAELLQLAVQLTCAAAVVGLCKLPSAAGLSSAVAADVLRDAARQGLCVFSVGTLQSSQVKAAIDALFTLPAVQSLDSVSINTTLQVCLQPRLCCSDMVPGCRPVCSFVDGLCRLRGALKLSSAAVGQLIAEATRSGYVGAVQRLTELMVQLIL